MLLGPVYSQITVPLKRGIELVAETGYFPIVTEDALLVSFLDPKTPDFYNCPGLATSQLIASQEGKEYRLTVAGIHFLANCMRSADLQ